MPPNRKASMFIGLMALSALSVMGVAFTLGQQTDIPKLAALLALALATARLKVKLPGLTGNMAVNLPFLFVALEGLDMFAALLVALPACALQCVPKGGGKLIPRQVVFNLSTTAVAIAAASLASGAYPLLGPAAFFVVQTVAVASIIGLTEGGVFSKTWSGIAHYSFPFYVLSAGMASMATAAGPIEPMLLMGVPVLYAIYRSYQSYFGSSTLAEASAGPA